MVGSVGQSVGDFFETENDMNLLEMVNSFENLWIWFEIVQNFKFDFKNRFESDDRVWRSKKENCDRFMISG